MGTSPVTNTLPQRQLGRSDLKVSAVGLGCMGMSYAYGTPDEQESLRTLHRYVERGGTFLDTAEIYGPFDNERLVGRFLKEVDRGAMVVATKFGFKVNAATREITGADSSPANIRKVCDESLGRLGIDRIDLFYQHRVDPNVPIEDVVGTLADLIRAGKVRAIGLSEAAADTLRRASAVHPIAALQSEYSLWSREPETNDVLATCRELGIGFVPYSPLGRGFLTGRIQRIEDLDADDYRRTSPRFVGENFARNLHLVDEIRAIAADKGCTPAQLALAWVLAQGEHVVPIPGTKQRRYLDENLGALDVRLDADDLSRIDRVLPPGAAAGLRYPEAVMGLVGR